jgi:methylmalonyl-CoA mutase
MTVEPFDANYKKPDDLSQRAARNQQIILKHESYFNKVTDPSAGSYYIENLTQSIADAAWALFLETEEAGGFEKIVASGFIKNEIEKTCQKRDMDIAMRKQVFVGTNQYPNLSEKMLDKLQPTAKLSDLGGLRQYRGTQAFEALRLAVENHARKGFSIPKVFLFTYGNLAMRKARASFATNFFGVAGYEIADNPGFKTIDAGVDAALQSGANIVVLCSSDEEYADMIPAISKIKEQAPNTIVVVAGNPKELLEQLDQAGTDHYIHMRSNVLDALTHFNQVMEIA